MTMTLRELYVSVYAIRSSIQSDDTEQVYEK